jgi:hypothetical protein
MVLQQNLIYFSHSIFEAIFFRFRYTFSLCECACKDRTTFFFSKSKSIKIRCIFNVFLVSDINLTIRKAKSIAPFVRFTPQKVIFKQNRTPEHSGNQPDIDNMLLKPVI